MDRPSAGAAHPSTALAIPGVEDLVPVGGGGFGTVYRGRQPAFDREVAVKVLDRVAGGRSSAGRWRRELAAMGRLSNHPNIVPIYDSGVTADGLPYLVMPFVPGGSLADVVRERGPLPAPEVAALGAKLAGALASAHERGVLHRDVKPANVLLSPFGEPQLTDFGIARIDDTSATATAPQELALTVAYAAPEVLTGSPATARSDVYSLAATLFVLLTGEPPFRPRPDEVAVAFVLRVARETPGDLRQRGVPRELAEVVEAGLAKDPDQRVADAQELQRRLEAAAGRLGASHDTVVIPSPPPPATAIGAAPAAAPPAPRRERPPSPPGRRPGSSRAVLLGLLALLVVAAGAALLLASGGSDGDDPEEAVVPSSVAPTDAPTDAADTTDDADDAGGDDREEEDGAEAGVLDDLALSYLETLAAGDLDGAFAMLSPGMQRSQPRSAFDSFWGGLGSIEIVGPPRVDRDDAAVTVPVAFDGAREDYRLTFVHGDDGSWLIDGPRPR
jgi:hypothetical protein